MTHEGDRHAGAEAGLRSGWGISALSAQTRLLLAAPLLIGAWVLIALVTG
jgi:hypothetical protein